MQGVFFRASARQQALDLGVTGYAHNLPDQRVEVLCCGDSANLELFKEWLKVGPPAAHISNIQCEQTAYQAIADFSTG